MREKKNATRSRQRRTDNVLGSWHFLHACCSENPTSRRAAERKGGSAAKSPSTSTSRASSRFHVASKSRATRAAFGRALSGVTRPRVEFPWNRDDLLANHQPCWPVTRQAHKNFACPGHIEATIDALVATIRLPSALVGVASSHLGSSRRRQGSATRRFGENPDSLVPSPDLHDPSKPG
jgi:hypothetical protein